MHAWNIVELLTLRTDVTHYDVDHHEEWEMSLVWLEMAAGLKSVDIDLAALDSSTYMCSNAADYVDARSDSVSPWQTELTRLMYCYSSLENIVLILQSLSQHDRGITRIAKKILRRFPTSGIPHFNRVVAHLKEHILDAPFLCGNRKMSSALLMQHGYSRAVIALQAGVQLRHLLTHGALQQPDPNATDKGWAPGGMDHACLARQAISCLLFVLQMLPMCALREGKLRAIDDPVEVDEGVWLPSRNIGDTLIEEASVIELLGVIHLETGYEPEPPIKGQLAIETDKP